MPNKTIDALVFCPFYICEAKSTITCEGIIGSQTISRFSSEAAKKEHEMSFCTEKHCRGCGVFSSLMQNYHPTPPSAVHIRH